MTLAAATVTLGPRPGLTAGAALPVEALVLGRPVAEVADLLPRLFNLCRAAQGMAAKLSLGLPVGLPAGLPVAEDPGTEVIRDHVLKLCVTLPRAFSLPGLPILQDPATLLGPHGLPDDPADLHGPASALARLIASTFPPGTATCPELPPPSDPLAAGAFENSAAGRQCGHPLLRRIEKTHGRGPLWRYAGLLADLEAAIDGRLPAPVVTDGTATVPAARGTYALRITAAHGLVTGLIRRTPTDHLLAPGGALLRSLASLPPALHHLAPQVIALHDPCIPVRVREAQDA